MNTSTNQAVCPCCNLVINFMKSVTKNDIKPQAGIASVCTECGEICVIQADLTLVKMTDEQKEVLKKKAPVPYNTMLRLSAYFQKRFANKHMLFPTPQSLCKN